MYLRFARRRKDGKEHRYWSAAGRATGEQAAQSTFQQIPQPAATTDARHAGNH
jgi:hypothetical protein